ncbi:hypothetical protein G1K66_08390 [Tenacibaculum finnmarkense]|uniref:hypothetical protein n=1 Tax=Tenacibaculum finnmarkense TaxID=2781243 RepID=UPI001EFB99C9|nr:hypothetical protein [Tenacibaculum finnmarkense]MCG8813278.1 hypothetical protein [Tenacibaculum finnmarkense]
MSNKISIIKNRLREYTIYKGFSHRKFNHSINASDSFLKSNGGFNVDFLPVIRQNYPDLNTDWLLFDEGEMVVSSEKEENTQKLDTMKKEMKNYKQMYYEQLDKNMLLHEKLLACMEGDNFSKDVG